jgi:hypothetical protein
MAGVVLNQPWPKGQTYQLWGIPLMTDQEPDDLTGVDITRLNIIFRDVNGNETTGTGTVSLMQVYPAIILYKVSVTDSYKVFTQSIVVRGFYPPSNSAADQVEFNPIPFTIS